MKLQIGSLTNCYIIADEEKKEAMVIDPAAEVDRIMETLKLLEVDLKYIYITHCHADHTGGVNKLRKKTNAKVLIHRIDAENFRNPDVNLCNLIGTENIEFDADSRVDDNDELHIGNLEFKVIHTPGHTNGGSCLYVEKNNILFSGDTLFKGTYGRCDLPTRK